MQGWEIQALAVAIERLGDLEAKGTIGPKQAKRLAEMRERLAQELGMEAKEQVHP